MEKFRGSLRKNLFWLANEGKNSRDVYFQFLSFSEPQIVKVD